MAGTGRLLLDGVNRCGDTGERNACSKASGSPRRTWQPSQSARCCTVIEHPSQRCPGPWSPRLLQPLEQ